MYEFALPTPMRQCFDYLPRPAAQKQLSMLPTEPCGVPEGHKPLPGCRYWVELGNRKVVGIYRRSHREPTIPLEDLKPVQKIIDKTPVICGTLWDVADWAARYYQHPIGEVLTHMLPVALRNGDAAQRKVRQQWVLSDAGRHADTQRISKKAPLQADVLQTLQQYQHGLPKELVKALKLSDSALRGLEKKKLIELQQIKHPSGTWRKAVLDEQKSVLASAPLTANKEQQTAINAIKASINSFAPFLLEGVTGSGKTEVYLQAITECLNAGRQALILVPEIGLTPQTIQRFKARFNVPVIALHSNLSDQERLNAWLDGRDGEAALIIGTRSAIFTPLRWPGLIVVDEEHDASFKQQDGFRYCARDIAIVRAKKDNIPVVLGSATPSLETLHNAINQRYAHLTLHERAGNAKPPPVHLIDIRALSLQSGLSTPTLDHIEQHLAQQQQVLVFLNQRGFSPTLLCRQCGWIADCRRCDARLTLHRRPPGLHCHHCDWHREIPKSCPKCQSLSLAPLGQGTERVEESLQQRFPKTRIIRVDRDTVKKKNAMDTISRDINKGMPCILIGTQMLAKGHHFPHVTLAAIIDIDNGLLAADFRANERTGQLITQVAGRAGRAEKHGEVVLQTHQPEHPALQILLQNGYQAYARHLLAERALINFPPYGHLGLIRAEANNSDDAHTFLQMAADRLLNTLKEKNLQLDIMGPVTAPMEVRAGRYRWQLLLRSDQRTTLQQLLSETLSSIEKMPEARKVRWSIDVDPYDLY